MNRIWDLWEGERITETIALFVTGGSPAILTETLAAYAGEGGLPVPQKIRVTTTCRGLRDLKKAFLDNDGWSDFVREYPVYAGTPFDEGCIVIRMRKS